jgi:phage terminase large subunit-like protein
MMNSMISWIHSKADELAVDAGCWFDLKAAERVRYFFEKYLRHSKGKFAGKPFVLLDWQWEQLIAPVFGWRRADGTRRFRRGYVQIPKKNGKSTLGAGIALYLLIGDKEPGAEIYSAAADRRQASIVFNEAANMVRSSPMLRDRVVIRDSKKLMMFPQTRSTYEALSADVKTKEGINAHGVVFDELHAQPNRLLFDTLRYAGAAREQPLSIAITTAGFDRESICYEQYQYAKRVLEGNGDNEYFALIYETSSEAEWTQEPVWKEANPSYGATIPASDFASACREAQENVALENTFKRYRLNIWTEQDVRWIPLERWDLCKSKKKFNPKKFYGLMCHAGLDLASTSDINALVLYFPKYHALIPHFWVPQATIKDRIRKGKTSLDVWAKQGFITVTPGQVTDYNFIRDDINKLADLYDIRDISVDRWNALQIMTQLQGDGFDVCEFGQGFFSMSAPTKEFDRQIRKQELVHYGNPVMRWMVGNVVVETDDADNYKPSKKKSGEKIDGVTAAIMAVGRYMALREDDDSDDEGNAEIVMV